MAIRVLFATAHRQTLTIQYENPFGDCFTEYDLDEYTAQDVTKTGREPFLTIRAAQWRAVCRDLLNARKVDSKQIHKALVRFASPAARQIFFEECEKSHFAPQDQGRIHEGRGADRSPRRRFSDCRTDAASVQPRNAG